jgi:hypothetical protein
MGRTAPKMGFAAGDFHLGKICADIPTFALLLTVNGLLMVSQTNAPFVEKFPPRSN